METRWRRPGYRGRSNREPSADRMRPLSDAVVALVLANSMRRRVNQARWPSDSERGAIVAGACRAAGRGAVALDVGCLAGSACRAAGRCAVAQPDGFAWWIADRYTGVVL